MVQQIEEKQILREGEINDFCTIYFAPKRKETVHDHAKMNGILDLAVERYKALDENEQEEITMSIQSVAVAAWSGK